MWPQNSFSVVRFPFVAFDFLMVLYDIPMFYVQPKEISVVSSETLLLIS